MNTSAIVAIVMGVLMMVLSFTLYPTLNSAMDDLYLYWIPSCESNGDRFVRAYVGHNAHPNAADANNANVYITGATIAGDNGKFFGSGLRVSASDSNAGGCRIEAGNALAAAATAVTAPATASTTSTGASSVTLGYTFYNERGRSIQVPAILEPAAATWMASQPLVTAGSVTSTQIAGSPRWVAVPSLLNQFGGIGQLVLSVMPILVLASFLGLVAMGLIEYGRGMSAGGIGSAVGLAILQLIVVIVILEVLPTIIDAMVDANSYQTAYSVNTQFSGIMSIIFAALPLLLIVGILGISGFMLFQRQKKFRSSGGFGFGG